MTNSLCLLAADWCPGWMGKGKLVTPPTCTPCILTVSYSRRLLPWHPLLTWLLLITPLSQLLTCLFKKASRQAEPRDCRIMLKEKTYSLSFPFSLEFSVWRRIGAHPTPLLLVSSPLVCLLSPPHFLHQPLNAAPSATYLPLCPSIPCFSFSLPALEEKRQRQLVVVHSWGETMHSCVHGPVCLTCATCFNGSFLWVFRGIEECHGGSTLDGHFAVWIPPFFLFLILNIITHK